MTIQTIQTTTDTATDLWDDDTAILLQTDAIDVPRWIDQYIDSATVDAICQGGCDSGAYMPAVTYHQALETMSEYGDDVLQYIEDSQGTLPDVSGESWAGMACKYLSCAVELWARGAQSELESIREG